MVNHREHPHSEPQAESHRVPRKRTNFRSPLTNENVSGACRSNAAFGMPHYPGYVYDRISKLYFKQWEEQGQHKKPDIRMTRKRTPTPKSVFGLLGGMENGSKDGRCTIASKGLSKGPERVDLTTADKPKRVDQLFATDETIYPFYHSASRIIYLCGYPSGKRIFHTPVLLPLDQFIHTENATVICRHAPDSSLASFYIIHNTPPCIDKCLAENVCFCAQIDHSPRHHELNEECITHEPMDAHSVHRNCNSFQVSVLRKRLNARQRNYTRAAFIDTLTCDGDTTRRFKTCFMHPKSDITAVGQNEKNVHVGFGSGYVSVVGLFTKNKWRAGPLNRNYSVSDIQAPKTADCKTFFCSYIRNGPKNLVLWDTRISGKRGPGISFKGHRNSRWKLQMDASEELGLIASPTDDGFVKLWDCRKGDNFMDAIDMRSELGVGERLLKVWFERGRDFVHKALWIETSHSLFLSRM